VFVNALFKNISTNCLFFAKCCYDATMNKQEQIQADKELIALLGGTTVVAKRIGVKSPQRVHNWLTRGIPASVKLAHPKLFLKGLKK
jgi:hypothetical protein